MNNAIETVKTETVENNSRVSVKIELIQKGTTLVRFNKEISESAKVSTVGSVIAAQILLLRDRKKRFNLNLNGFNFSRKFDVKLSIEGKQVNGIDLYDLGELAEIQGVVTIQNTQKSLETFAKFIKDLTEQIMFDIFDTEADLPELVELYGLDKVAPKTIAAPKVENIEAVEVN